MLAILYREKTGKFILSNNLKIVSTRKLNIRILKHDFLLTGITKMFLGFVILVFGRGAGFRCRKRFH